jgi:hypothetical protein
VIEVDPKIEQAFAEVLARSRHRAADITDRLAAKQREIAEASKRLTEEGRELSDALDRKVEAKKESARNPWQNRESKPTVLAFAADDEDERRPAAPQPVTQPAVSYPLPPPPAPAPEPEPAPAARDRVLSFGVEDEEDSGYRAPTPPRPAAPPAPAAQPRPSAAADDEDDDWSGRSWVR